MSRAARGLVLLALVLSSTTLGCRKETVQKREGHALDEGARDGMTKVTLGKDLSEMTSPLPYVIRLEREACYGLCPIYTLEISEDGRVDYVGKEFVRERGARSKTIAKARVALLRAHFEQLGYFRLSWEDPCPSGHTDASTAVTTFVSANRKRTIRDYHGNYCVPKPLRELEDEIDRVVGVTEWTRCEGGVCDQ